MLSLKLLKKKCAFYLKIMYLFLTYVLLSFSALASAHHRRIVTEGFCRVPQPRVERIRRDSWKIYTPHCTILHRCADDAGCCPSERQTCAPKRTKTVELYFFVS